MGAVEAARAMADPPAPGDLADDRVADDRVPDDRVPDDGLSCGAPAQAARRATPIASPAAGAARSVTAATSGYAPRRKGIPQKPVPGCT